MWRLVTLLALSALGSRALAHGAPPTATELLAMRDGNASLVRIAPGGLAQRVANGFRFVCPEAWDGNVLAPVVGLTQGPTLVASDMLYVVDQDGHVAPHPAQSGRGVALARGRELVFGVFERGEQHELRRLSGESNELVRTLEQPFGVLAAGDQLSLLHWLNGTLTLQKLSLHGEASESVTWSVSNGVAYAHLRVVADQLYVMVWGNSSPWVTIGRIADGHVQPLREGNIDIVGPVALGADSLVSIDGTLQWLGNGLPIDTLGRRVTCLGEVDGTAYACANGDLYRVDASGTLGAPLFELSSLREPDYQSLSDHARSSCNTRWLDLRVDISTAQAARVLPDAGANSVDAAMIADAAPASTAEPAGCSAHVGGSSDLWPSALLLLALVASTRRRVRSSR